MKIKAYFMLKLIKEQFIENSQKLKLKKKIIKQKLIILK